MGPYCKPAERSFPDSEIDCSCDGSVGEVILKDNDLKGNMASLGFPARSDITPGLFSNGNSPRTEVVPLRYYCR